MNKDLLCLLNFEIYNVEAAFVIFAKVAELSKIKIAITGSSRYRHCLRLRLRSRSQITERNRVKLLLCWLCSASDVICERSSSRHQWGAHWSAVWAKSTVFPRIHLPSGVHGHSGGRYEWWEVTWTENKVTETKLTINQKIFHSCCVGPQVTQAVSEKMPRYERLQFLCLG